MGTEGHGVPLGWVVEGAHRHDMTRARATVNSLVVTRPPPTAAPPQGLCLDQGDDDQDVREILAALGCTAPVHARGEAAHAIKDHASPQARRWVVARTHAWMNRVRRSLGRWDNKPEHDLACLHWACALMAFRAAG